MTSKGAASVNLTGSLPRPLQEDKTVKVDIHHFYPTLTDTLFLSELLCTMVWSMHCPPQAAYGILPLPDFYYKCTKIFPLCVFICLLILFMTFSAMQFLVFIWMYHIFYCLWRTVFCAYFSILYSFFHCCCCLIVVPFCFGFMFWDKLTLQLGWADTLHPGLFFHLQSSRIIEL